MKKILPWFGLLGLLGACATGPTPFTAERDASADIRSTIQTLDTDKRALLTFGANWCSDSRALASAYTKEPLQSLLASNYDIVFIDVGERNRNLDLAEKFNAPVMAGIPSIVVVDAGGDIRFSSRAEDLKNAANMSQQDIFEYFDNLVKQTPK